MKLGERIKAARTSAGLSLAQLAFKMGFKDGRSPLCKWENGDREPKLGNLAKLAEATGKPLSYFVKVGTTFPPVPVKK